MVPYTYKGSHDTYLKYAASTPKLDPAVLVPYLAHGDQDISGWCRRSRPASTRPICWPAWSTRSTTRPKGRIGWNCVTSSNDGAAQNYGTTGRSRTTIATRWPTSSPTSSRGCGRRGSPTPWCSTATSRCSPTAQGPSDQPRRQIFQGARTDQRAALAAGPRADLPGRRLAARPGLRRQMGRHDHHQCRHRGGHEELP